MSLIGRPLQLQQKYLHQSNKVASKISMLFKLAGYSSLAAALVSILIYWYKRYSPSNEMERKLLQEKDAIIGDELYITPKKRHSDFGYSNSLRRTSSTLSDISRDQVVSPPAILPIVRPITPPRATSPRGWGSRFIDGVMLATTNIRKKKKMTISMKNTILWNPSRDVNTPNHAFHENSVLLLNRLSQLYDVYVIIHINSEEEKAQIHQLLKNANILNHSNQGSIDERKVLYCSSEEGKAHIIKHLEPSIHIEGGWEKDDGHILVQSLYEAPSVQHIVWVVSNQIRPFHEGSVDGSIIELADKMINSTLAKQVGF